MTLTELSHCPNESIKPKPDWTDPELDNNKIVSAVMWAGQSSVSEVRVYRAKYLDSQTSIPTDRNTQHLPDNKTPTLAANDAVFTIFPFI